MNYKLRLLFVSFTFSGVQHSAAQVRQSIRLQQALEMSFTKSGTLKINEAKITEASAAVKEAQDRKLPDAKITGSYLRLGGADVNIKTHGNSGTSGGNNNTPKVNQALYGIANISMPLYAGGRIRYGIESAKYLEQAAWLTGAHDKLAIAYNTILAYTNLYKAGGTVELIRQHLLASKQRDATFSRLEETGLLARNDLLKSQLQTSNIELSLIDAENEFNLANVNMAVMLGLPENTQIQIDSNFIELPKEIQPFIAMENLALQNRKDLQALGLREKASAVGIKSANAEAYPSLALTGGYIAADIPKLITITNAVNIGLGIQYNLSSLWKTNTKLIQAKALQTEIKASEQILDDAIRLQVNSDYLNYLLAQKKIAVSEKAKVQAAENYRITKNKYNNSLVTVTDLLEADVMLLQTKLNIAVAKADAALAYNKLLETTGTLSK